MRVIIDTNVLISMLISGSFSWLRDKFESRYITFVFSEELFSEFVTVAMRPKFRRWFSEAEVAELLQLLSSVSEVYTVNKSSSIKSRDSNDDFLLALALESKADYLVSGDDDLLVLDQIGITKVVTPNNFKNILYGLDSS